jgi:LPXTG-site transpeptidase (sortase) family protein
LLVMTGLVLAIGGTWLQLSDPGADAGAGRGAGTGFGAEIGNGAGSGDVVGTGSGSSGPGRSDAVPEAAKAAGVVPAASSAAGRRARSPGRPVQVVIGRLGVVAPVVAIGVEGGALTPPSNPRNVGWWSGGVRPGALRGTAVITGHTVHAGGGAFDELERLRAGDSIEVSTSRGVLNYRVAGVSTYRKQALARSAAELFDQSGPGRLVLVTCEDWNGRTYLSNVVVVARLMA